MKAETQADKLFVEHMLECMDRIDEYTGGKRDVFAGSRLIQDAVIRNLQTLAESGQRLSESARAREPSVDWRGISGFRNVLVHGYLGVDAEVVWRVVEQDLPGLRTALRRMRDALETRSPGADKP